MYKYPVISFISGFIVMAVELIASRVVAPIIGSSIFTWTSVIGVVLLGISLGNYAGGKMADEKPSNRLLSIFLSWGSVFVVSIPILATLTKPIVFLTIPLILKTLIIALVLFFVPALFLGTIFPIALKLYVKQLENVGGKAGVLSALAALGSIVGTFSTGFILVGLLGSSVSLYLLAAILLSTSRFFEKRVSLHFLLAISIAALLVLVQIFLFSKSPDVVFETESNYYKISVSDRLIAGKPARILFLDFDSHSIESLGEKNIGTYQDIGPIIKTFANSLDKTLFLGGGSYNIPKDIVELYNPKVTVAELDPEVTQVANDFFNLSAYPIKTNNIDGRVFLS